MTIVEEEVSPPFVRSKAGTSFYCPYESLPQDIKAKLSKDNGSKLDFKDKYEINVKVMNDGTVLTFVNEKKAQAKTGGTNQFFAKKKARVLEVQMLPITEANTILRVDKDLEYIATHSYGGNFYCECVKREGATSLSTNSKTETVADIIRERDELKQALANMQQFRPATEYKVVPNTTGTATATSTTEYKPASEYEDPATNESTKTW